MRRLRESWLALGGSALIVALSITSALGADPAFDPAGTVGEQVSEFARSLAPGQNTDADEGDAEEQPAGDEDATDGDEAPDGDEEATDEEATEADLEPGDEGYVWANHGECVSWHAHQDESAEGNEQESGEDWKNHGEFVSFWAREGCREEAPDEEATDEAAEAAEADGDDDDADGEKAKKPKRNNGNGNGNGRGSGRGGRP